MWPAVDVYLGSEALLVGHARFMLRRGRVTTSFFYDESYLALPDAFALDPALPLTSRSGFAAGLPGAFADSAPDRWGRRLIQRGAARALDDVDYLLGVYDGARQGALRFKLPGADGFCTEDAEIPPVVQLPRLLAACRVVLTEDDAAAEVKRLLEAGSSTLGGARPKATVIDGEDLYIAKFPSPRDGHNVMAWEKTALDLALSCGLTVPVSRLVHVGSEPVLLVKRFDRSHGERVPYLSAMSLMGARDGEAHDYVELAEALGAFSGNPERDLRELFGRVAFSIAFNNTDDHLRNHGFLRRNGRWGLSPVFDVNPDPNGGAERATAIFGECGVHQAKALRGSLPYFGLSLDEGRSIVGTTLDVVSRWRSVACHNGCPEAEVRMFGSVFEQRGHDLRDAFGI